MFMLMGKLWLMHSSNPCNVWETEATTFWALARRSGISRLLYGENMGAALQSSHSILPRDLDVTMAEVESGIEAIKARMSRINSTEGRLRALSFIPRSDDVIVATSPKAGTTWVQQIIHQLRTRGSMDFAEITEVVPYIEQAVDLGINLEADQAAVPRAFKTHCWYDHCPRGGKYIVVMRDPRAVAPSYYRMMCGWVFQPEELDMATFISQIWMARGKPQSKLVQASYWHFYASWWPHRSDPNVLWLFYEDMVDDHLGAVKKIAKFMNCGDDDDELHQLVVKQSTLAFMKQNVHKFDDHLIRVKRNEALGVSKNATGVAKVNEGRTDGYMTILSPELIQAIDDKWKLIEEVTGFASYDDLCRNFSTC